MWFDMLSNALTNHTFKLHVCLFKSQTDRKITNKVSSQPFLLDSNKIIWKASWDFSYFFEKNLLKIVSNLCVDLPNTKVRDLKIISNISHQIIWIMLSTLISYSYYITTCFTVYNWEQLIYIYIYKNTKQFFFRIIYLLINLKRDIFVFGEMLNEDSADYRHWALIFL